MLILALEHRGDLSPLQWIVAEKARLYLTGLSCFIGRAHSFALSKHFSPPRNWIEKDRLIEVSACDV